MIYSASICNGRISGFEVPTNILSTAVVAEAQFMKFSMNTIGCGAPGKLNPLNGPGFL
jgi:hypothetical protein